MSLLIYRSFPTKLLVYTTVITWHYFIFYRPQSPKVKAYLVESAEKAPEFLL